MGWCVNKWEQWECKVRYVEGQCKFTSLTVVNSYCNMGRQFGEYRAYNKMQIGQCALVLMCEQ